MAFDVILLALLVDPQARSLAAAWVALPKLKMGSRGAFAAWAGAAGVPTSVAARIGGRLIVVGICLPGGQVPNEVRQFVADAAASQVVNTKSTGRTKK